jgi:hypothetical protein
MLIPVGEGFFVPAKFVKLRDNRQVLCLPRKEHHGDPYAVDLFLSPDYSSQDVAKPIPIWFNTLLNGPSPAYHTLHRTIADLDNWNATAEVERYCRQDDRLRHLRDELAIVQAEVHLAKDDLAACRQMKVPSSYHPNSPRCWYSLHTPLALSRPCYRPSLTSTPPSSSPLQMDYSRPSQIARLTQLLPIRPMRITSITWNSTSSTTRIPSITHPRASWPMTGKSATSTSQWGMDYLKGQSGSASTTTAWSLAITHNRGRTNSCTLSTYMPPPTTPSTCPSTPYPHGSDTYSVTADAVSP